MTAADALELYGSEHAPTVKDPVRIGHAIAALVPIVGSLPVAGLTSEVCRRYAKARGKAAGTIRKELGTLQAAVNHCHAEGYLTAAPKLRLPAKPPSPRSVADSRRGREAPPRRLSQPEVPTPCASFILDCHLHRHPVRGHPPHAVHAEQPKADGSIPTTRHHAPSGSRRSRDDQAAPADPDPAPASRSPSTVGAQRRPLRGRGRRAACRLGQDGMADGARRSRHRPLHPARSSATRAVTWSDAVAGPTSGALRADFSGISRPDLLERVYGHHHPGPPAKCGGGDGSGGGDEVCAVAPESAGFEGGLESSLKGFSTH